MTAVLRQELGDFNSVVCFKAAIAGMEEALGEKATAIALIAAGRNHGKKLAQELGLADSSMPLDALAEKMSNALGKDGTRLCKVEKIVQEGDVIKVYTTETVCSAGEPQGSSRSCTFTLGAIWGALEQVLGKRLQGKHTESVLRGGSHDVFEFREIASSYS
jgi:predicted hydrocarbon binding protein